jgi:hypothetical protein
MNSQNILKYYGTRFDVKLDSSEFYDYEISKVQGDYATDILDFSGPITYTGLTISDSLAGFSCGRGTITFVEYDNTVNDDQYIYSGLTFTLSYNNFVNYFGSPYEETILNNHIYTYTGITGETHYFRIGGFNNELDIDERLSPGYTSTPTPTPTITLTPTPTQTITPTVTPTPQITTTLTPTITQTLTPTKTVTPTVTLTPTITVTATPTYTITPTYTVTPTPVDPPNIVYSPSTITQVYGWFNEIIIPSPINYGGTVLSYSLDVPLYPDSGYRFNVTSEGRISFNCFMGPGTFDIYVTATNSGGEDIKRIRIILTT